MAEKKFYLTFDLGAESGRAIMGTLENGKLSLSEEHRFLTGAESVPTMYPDCIPEKMESDCSLLWDFTRFWHEIKSAIKKVSKKVSIRSAGVDAWGVDFALLDKNGMLIASPYNYRDSRTNSILEEVYKHLPKKRIYDINGIQFMSLNSLPQLLSLVVNDSPVLKITEKFLMVPDLINYWLTGRAVAEFTEATTSQLFDPHKGDWSEEIIKAMGFPHHIFPEIVQPGTILGPLRQSVAKELNTELTVVAPATHDTGSAVAAVPAEGNDFAWISSGTWSIVGMNVPEPVINEDSFKYNFTNEGGIGGTYRFSKNVMGLWVVQQCRQEWMSEGKNYSYGELTKMAADVPLSTSFVDPDYSKFLKPGNMVEKVQEFCKMTGQTVPITEGEVIRAVLIGLALRYRYVIEKLEEISGKNLSAVHIVGGGTKNKLLSQMTADALGRKVITGPIEATAIGNIIVQAIAMGDIKDWKAGVEVIKNSFEIRTFGPGDGKPWDIAFEEFVSNLGKTTLAF